MLKFNFNTYQDNIIYIYININIYIYINIFDKYIIIHSRAVIPQNR